MTREEGEVWNKKFIVKQKRVETTRVSIEVFSFMNPFMNDQTVESSGRVLACLPLASKRLLPGMPALMFD